MIFDIKILLHEFQKEKDENPADINLLFIEEPEVHTHPQMQYIFIKNIKKLLDIRITSCDEKIINLQTVISTHSSHIVSESDFEDIKYFKKEPAGITSKNLSTLKESYSDDTGYYKFLKQYLTLHKAELFSL
jgi:predicted ATP-dependent endonuclease of OLD family